MRSALSSLLIIHCFALPGVHAETDPGEEIAQLKTRIALLEERLARIEGLAAGGLEAETEIEAERVVVMPAQRPAEPSWTESVRLSGDLRYRHESVNDDAFDERHLHRIRARANITADLDDNMTAGFGLSTGGVANDSGNQTLDGGFSRKSVGVDLAFFDWKLSDRLNLVGGKMPNPFFRPTGHHLIYDGDLRPEGLALKVNSGSFFANASAFWAEERGAGPDSMWYGLQVGYRGQPANGIALTTGASVYEISHAQGRAPIFTPLSGQGNQLDANGNYLYGFSQIELFGELRIDLAGHPMTAFMDYVTNTAAEAYGDGLAVGVGYRRASDRGTWNVGYIYQDLEANAVVGAFNSGSILPVIR